LLYIPPISEAFSFTATYIAYTVTARVNVDIFIRMPFRALFFSQSGFIHSRSYPTNTIFPMGDQFQMLGVYTGMVAAKMVGFNSFRYRSFPMLIGEAVSHNWPSRSIGLTADGKFPVSQT
jgi:hypothetical protein